MRNLLLVGLIIITGRLNAQHPKLMLPIGHTEEIVCVQYSPDSKKILTASMDNTAKIWDAETGQLLSDLRGHSARIFYAEFSPDGKKVITASNDATAIIWDVNTGTETITITGHSRYLSYASFSPDSKKVVTASGDYTAKVWDAGTGKLITPLNRHGDAVTLARFSPDGQVLLTHVRSKFYRQVNVWNPVTGQLIHALGHDEQINSAEFSPDGKLIVTASDDKTVKIWSVATGLPLIVLKDSSGMASAAFSPDSKNIITTRSYDRDRLENTVQIRDAATGQLVRNINVKDLEFANAKFSPDGKMFITSARNKYQSPNYRVLIWETGTGQLINTISIPGYAPSDSHFSADGKKIVTVFDQRILRIWDVRTGNPVVDLTGHSHRVDYTQTSTDGKKILTVSWNHYAKIWDAGTGILLANLKGCKDSIELARFSTDGKRIVTASRNKHHKANIWDVNSGELIAELTGHSNEVYFAAFSPDGKKIVTQSSERVKIWNAESGMSEVVLKPVDASINSIGFSSDWKKFVTTSTNNKAEIWDVTTGKMLSVFEIDEKPGVLYPEQFTGAEFSPDGMKIVTIHNNKTVRVWEISSSQLLREFKVNTGYWLESASFSMDGKKIFTYSLYDESVEIWDASTGKLLIDLKHNPNDTSTVHSSSEDKNIGYAISSPDGKKIITTTWDQSAVVWDITTGKQLQTIDIDVNESINKIDLINNRVITINNSETCLYDLGTGKKLYSFVALDSTGYILTNNEGRYDGTDEARKLLYFTCGTEVVELEQVKDQLWVPNLAQRINNGKTINAKTIDELNICGLTPEVSEISTGEAGYFFKISPRRGGLGETVLYVNRIEAKRYKPAQLKKNGDVFELFIKKDELNGFFIPGSENPVTVKAYTADNAFSSRGLRIREDKTRESTTPPNFYAVMIGVSDYKGDELDLKYAAKDATDISAVVNRAAKKLLNNDGKEHVFIYNLTTAKEQYQLPEKNSIKKVLEEIGKKATANDILLFFFAGHGVMAGDQKQFYFLTADASQASATEAISDVGISMSELTEWMTPQHIKAQKRILIFDACNSGQAIKDFVKLGKDDQDYIAARNDDKTQQIKAIDKLNEKSGFFILSASASNQSAYEMGRYSQGLLTYALLKSIKQQPDILEEGKYLNVSRWFNAAEKTVSDISKENGARQEPQIVTNSNFNIGVVDDEIMTGIILPNEKPLFAASIFLNNDEAISDDDLEISKMLNMELAAISIRGSESKIVYMTATNSPDAYTLTGRYEVTGNEVKVKVNLKQNKEIKYRFELTGTNNKIRELVEAISHKAIEFAK